MIHTRVVLRVSDEKKKDVSEILVPIVQPRRRLSGCIESGLYHDVCDPNRILYEEHWEDDNSLDSHLASEKFREIMLAMELASEAPEVKFHSISKSSSMNRVARVRGG